MPADLLSLNSACLLAVCFFFAIPAGMVSHYQPCLLVYGLSLSAVPAGVVLHLKAMPFGLVPISNACWCCASLKAMPSGVVPHCSTCLLVWCLTICHACWHGTSLSAMPAGLFCTSTDILTN